MIEAQNAATSQPHPTPLMLTSAVKLEAQAAQMQAHAAALCAQYPDGLAGPSHTAQQLQEALQDAARQNCRAAPMPSDALPCWRRF